MNGVYPADPNDLPDLEGDCPDCGGTGEVSCNCDDHGCPACIDGMTTCLGCGGTGYRDDESCEWEDL